MIAVDVPTDWTIHDLMRRVTAVEENVYRVKLGISHKRPKSPAGEPMEDVRGSAGRLNDKPKGKRADWVSPDEIARRKEQRLCFRCGKGGHQVSECRMKPAVRPTRVANGRAEDKEDSDDEVESEN